MAKNKSASGSAERKETVSQGFSTKRKNNAPAPAAKPEKDKLTKKQIIILVAVLLVAVIISSVIIGAVVISKRNDDPDVMKADLSKYVTVSSEDYKGYEINIPLDSYNEEGVTRKINMLLTEHKTLNEYYKGRYPLYEPLTVGNNVNIYFRGYTVDEKGRENDFEGGSNITSDSKTILEVGTGNVINEESGAVQYMFIPGFGERLVGIVPGDYASFEKVRNGRVMAGDVIYLSYKVTGPGGEKVVEGERIDLSLPYIDEIYGKGFTEFFVGKTNENGDPVGFKNIDEDISGTFEYKGEGDAYSTVYMDMKVEFVTRGCETAPITIDVTFPANYAEESLRGKAVKFDVYIRDAVVYDVPEYNESFITEKLKLTAEDLSAYSGATLIEKHTEKLRAEYKKEIDESNHALLTDAMWAHILSGVEIKKLPAKTVETYYNVYYGQINQYYSYYSSQYDSLDSFAITYLNSEYGANLASGADWKAYITSLAEGDTVQKLVFYYIIREEKLFPSDSDYQQIYGEVYNSILESTLELHESELAALSGEEYNKKVESLKDQIDSYYGESYFREQVYYYYGSRKMLEFATVK